MSDLSGFTAVSGSLFAACAAGASCVSVVRGQREARERRQPNLQASAEPIIGAKPGDDREALLAVINAGAGVARSSAFVLAAGTDEYCSNGLGAGFIRYQEKATARMRIQSHKALRALVMCRDLGSLIWVSDLQGKRKSYDGRRFDPRRDFAIFWADFYGEDLSGWQRIGSTVTITG